MNILWIGLSGRKPDEGAWVTYECQACGYITEIKVEDAFDPPHISCIMCGHEEKETTNDLHILS